MDVETAEVVETLRADIHRVEGEVVGVETSLTDIRLLAENLASLGVQ
jgi:hypothetical protein